MGLGMKECHWVACDHDGCYESSDEGHPEGGAPTEALAAHDAERSGYVQVGALWFCEEHNPNKSDEE